MKVPSIDGIDTVLKFGGSSVANPDRIRDTTAVVLRAARKGRVVVVVSAFQGVTDQLLECARLADTGDPAFPALYRSIVRRHEVTLDRLHGGRPPARVAAALRAMLSELRDVLQGIFLLRHGSPRALDLAASFGERLSALTIASYIRRTRPAAYVDARDVIRTDDRFTRAGVIFKETNEAVARHFKRLFAGPAGRVIPVVTGFIGATADGRTTTIGRNGSDYTAAIVGAALGAKAIEIWTDVDGVLSADPRAVGAAFVVPRMSYEEAMELSYFGATVLHASTIAPAVARRIPIFIRNTLNPGAPGTCISHRADPWEGVAKGITSIDDCTVLTLRGMNMVGVPGTADRLFGALARHGVSVILISQASSEHTICLAVSAADATAAGKAVREEFRYEMQSALTSLDERPRQTIVAVVGEGMKGTPGVSGRVFGALGRNGINITAIAQGASERNISFVIDADQRVRALNVIHEAFFERNKKLAVVLIGAGNIGGALLRQLHQQHAFLLSRGFDVRVCGITDSRRFVLSPAGIDLARWREELARSPRRMSQTALIAGLASLHLTNAVVVDCTASLDVVDRYEDYVRLNMHIVTPNKKANVLPWGRYRRLTELMKARQKLFLYEANVGAGLPIISTLNDLIASGDRVVRIEGILSGTLSHLFNHYDGVRPFSGLVREALELGYTEPDPRDDLSGGDVARKLLILARQLGLQMDLRQIRAENLVPRSLRGGPLTDGFFDRYAAHDAALKRRLDRARAHGAVLRYVGVLEGRAASAGIREVPAGHLFAATKGSDNIIAFTTDRYVRTPLVVQGPGAGADVTAMGVFSDLLKLLNWLPR
ncbi:MAG: bifunctional aspartate kinase/homoserine dehydrogenase I [Deltaproteobacteria bacterium]|nr:bifunctional aspartate kinase/homoserine dehydrogenase I [Deltaproteobacteria bacterium]